MVKILKMISNYNNSSRNGNSIKYIVMHYTGNKGDTARDNALYFNGGDRNASANYFVDNTEIYQVVEDARASWNCGDGKGKYGITNQNSISIEMCCDSNGNISTQTENNALDLVKYLQKKYNISNNNVVRHYDASRKICPNWSANNWERWTNFKNKLSGNSTVVTPPVVTPPIVSNSDNWVKRLQEECNAQGFSNQKVDGIAGTNTLNGCPTLKKGAKGNITKLLQEKVVNLGYSTNGVDGIFGNGTHNAVIQYQKSKGLSADGIVGQNTWRKLLGL